MNIYLKRERWCVSDETGLLAKFKTEEEAKEFAGWVPPVEEIEEYAEEEIETKDSEEEAYTDEQEIVCDGEGHDEEEV